MGSLVIRPEQGEREVYRADAEMLWLRAGGGGELQAQQ